MPKNKRITSKRPDWLHLGLSTSAALAAGVLLGSVTVTPAQAEPVIVEVSSTATELAPAVETIERVTLPEWHHATGVDIDTGEELARTASEEFSLDGGR